MGKLASPDSIRKGPKHASHTSMHPKAGRSVLNRRASRSAWKKRRRKHAAGSLKSRTGKAADGGKSAVKRRKRLHSKVTKGTGTVRSYSRIDPRTGKSVTVQGHFRRPAGSL